MFLGALPSTGCSIWSPLTLYVTSVYSSPAKNARRSVFLSFTDPLACTMAFSLFTQEVMQSPLAHGSGVEVGVGTGVRVGWGVGVAPNTRRVAAAQASELPAS